MDGISPDGSAWDPDPSLWPHSAAIMVRGSKHGATEAAVKMRIEGKGDPVSKRVPQQTCMMTDDSGSMSWNDPNSMRVAAMQYYIDQLQAPDEISHGAYASYLPSGNLAEIRQTLTTNYAGAKAAVAGFVSSGGTPIGNGLGVCNDELMPKQKPDFAWAIIHLTDGCRNSETRDPFAEVSTMNAKGIRLFNIGLYPDPNSSDKAMCEPQLIQWSQQTGGKYYWVQDPADLAQVYKDISDWLSSLTGTAPRSGVPMISLKLTDDIEAVNGSFRCDPGLCVDATPNNGTPIPEGNKGLRLEWHQPATQMFIGQVWQVEFKVRAWREGTKIKVNDAAQSWVNYDRFDRQPGGDAIDQLYLDVTHPVAPRVIWTSPSNGMSGVPADWPVEVRFDMTMDQATTAGAFAIDPPVPGSVTTGPDTIRFDHPSNLTLGTEYKVTIKDLAKSAAGVPMDFPHNFSFNTSWAPTPPKVVATNPYDGYPATPLDFTVTVLFDQAMDPLSTANAFLPSPQVGGSTYTVSNNQLTWTHASDFQQQTLYTVTISGSALSLAGVAMGRDYTFRFSTSAPPVRPRVEATDPLDAATDVPVDTRIWVRFNMQMDPSSVRAAFSVNPGPVSGTSEFTGVEFTFHPIETLAEGTYYTVMITETAANIGGNHLAEPHIFSFRTLKTPDNLAPEVSMVPANGTENVSTSTSIVLAFTLSMSTASVEGALGIQPSVPLKAAWGPDSRVLTLEGSTPLAPGTKYTVTLSTRAVSAAGAPLKEAFASSFTTAEPAPQKPGTIPEALAAAGALGWVAIALLALLAAVLLFIAVVRLRRRRERGEAERKERKRQGKDLPDHKEKASEPATAEQTTPPSGLPADGGVVPGAKALANARRALERRRQALDRIAAVQARVAERRR
jgi:hypothetical protein